MVASRVVWWVLVASLVLESAMLLVLSARHAELGRAIHRFRLEAQIPRAGAYYPRFVATAGGDPVPLSVGVGPEGRAQLILIYSRSCQYCRASLNAWRSLISQLDSLGTVDALVITLDSAGASRDSLRRAGIALPVVEFPVLESVRSPRRAPLRRRFSSGQMDASSRRIPGS